MALDGSGTYTPPAPEFPAVPDTTILAADFNAIIVDLATALSQAIFRDGQSPPTADIPMGTHKLTGLGNGVNAQDATTVAQVFTSPTFSSPTMTGTVTVPTATAGDSSTKAASTAFAMTMQSPAFTGTPTAPTAAPGTSTTQLATTAFVATAAFSSALPAQAGNSGKAITTNGTSASWTTFGTANQLLVVDGSASSITGQAADSHLAATTHAATSKTPPVDADEIPLSDSAASFALKKLTWANLKATILSYVLGVVNTWSVAQIGGVTSLTSSAGSVAVNLALSNNFSHTLTENTTLANPSNAVAGQSGCIAITQHASAAKTLSYASNWIYAPGSSNPTISTTTGSVNLISYYVVDSTHIWFSLTNHGVA